MNMMSYCMLEINNEATIPADADRFKKKGSHILAFWMSSMDISQDGERLATLWIKVMA